MDEDDDDWSRRTLPHVTPEIGAFDDPESYLRKRRGGFGTRFWKARAERRALESCLRATGVGGTVCDCPCGPGRLFPYWHARGAAILGVDASPNMVAAAKARLGSLDARGSVLLGDARALGAVLDATPDLVASVRFLYYFDRATRIALLRRFARVTRRFVLVQYKTNETRKGRRNAARERHGRQYASRAEIGAEIEAAGLELRALRFISRFSDRVFVLAAKGLAEPSKIS